MAVRKIIRYALLRDRYVCEHSANEYVTVNDMRDTKVCVQANHKAHYKKTKIFLGLSFSNKMTLFRSELTIQL